MIFAPLEGLINILSNGVTFILVSLSETTKQLLKLFGNGYGPMVAINILKFVLHQTSTMQSMLFQVMTVRAFQMLTLQSSAMSMYRMYKIA